VHVDVAAARRRENWRPAGALTCAGRNSLHLCEEGGISDPSPLHDRGDLNDDAYGGPETRDWLAPVRVVHRAEVS